MENMNLATRCREAIAQVAALKKELAVYQQRQSNLTGEYDGLKKEIGVLKRQIHGKMTNNNGIVNNGVLSNGVSGWQNNNGLATSLSAAEITLKQQQQRQPPRVPSPTTDLDRIMSSQKFGGKQKQSLTAEATTSTATNNENTADATKDKFNESAIISTNSKIPITIAPNNSSASANQNDDEFDADIDMVDFFTKQSSVVSSSCPPNTKSLHHHVRKSKIQTDDVMPEDMVGTGSGLGFSPEGKKGAVVGDSLLSSLDGGYNNFFLVVASPTTIDLCAKCSI
jgi:hypothetical protein